MNYCSSRFGFAYGVMVMLLWSSFTLHAQDKKDYAYGTKMWYTKPAVNWNEALPIGNGRLGAMIHGGVAVEKIQLNEQTLWSGGPIDGNNPNAIKYLSLVRAAVLAGKYHEADSLSKFMQGPYTESYMPMADLLVSHKLISDSSDYHRELDLDKAVSVVRFSNGPAKHTRTSFSSNPDDVIVVRYASTARGSINFSAALTSKLRYNVEMVNPNHIVLKGKCPKHVEPVYQWRIKNDQAIQYDDHPEGEGMTFDVHVMVKKVGGTIRVLDGHIIVEGANEATLFISAATSYNGYDHSPGKDGRDPSALALSSLHKASAKSFDAIQESHIKDHQSFFRRMYLNLGPGSNVQLPTDERLKLMKQITDPELVATVVQFGRYLLIAGSRQGGQPVNLKGIWNERLRPEYSSNWCIDHDAQMFYYAVETANLSELHEPFLQFIEDLSVNGRKTAAVNYGMGGWCAHHNTDIWRGTNPVGNWGQGNPHWATWNMSGPWLSAHLFEHYAFTGDKKFLRERAWPVMKGAAEFCLDWLIEGSDGKLISVPSVSPENTFITARRDTAQISTNSTSDIALMRELFSNAIRTCTILGVDAAFAERLTKALAKLPEYKVGSKGQLLEWSDEWQPVDPSHRHLSHMYPVFPGGEVTITTTPALGNAAKVALSLREKTNCSWGFSWKAACWARLGEADSAWQTWNYQLQYVDPKSTSSKNNYGLFPNFFNSDGKDVIMNGNGCATAVMNEMILQSHGGEISILPALPKVFSSGSVKGICARGGFVVDMDWKDGAITSGTLLSKLGGVCTLRSDTPLKVLSNGKLTAVNSVQPNVYTFETMPEQKFVLQVKN